MATSHNPSLLISSTSSNLCNSTITGAGSLSGLNTTSSPCAACKFLRRKCQPDCVFAPYFPPDNPMKFQNVHKVFGASNVTKLLNELQPYQREDAVNSLAYEADMRLRDPVYGCVGVISVLHHQMRQLQHDLNRAHVELARYQAAANLIGNIGPGSALHAGTGFGHEQFFQPQNGTNVNHQTIFRGLETGGINGAYNDSSLAAAIGFGSLTTGGLHFLKPSTVGGDERPSQV